MSDFKAKLHQIRFRLGLRPRPAGGAYSAPPHSLAGLKYTHLHILLRGGREKEGGEGGEGRDREKGKGGRGKGKGDAYTVQGELAPLLTSNHCESPRCDV